jgi:hypothetical protein
MASKPETRKAAEEYVQNAVRNSERRVPQRDVAKAIEKVDRALREIDSARAAQRKRA